MPRSSAQGRGLVLVASARQVLVSSLRVVLEPHGYECRHVGDLESARSAVDQRRPDVVIVDEDLTDPAFFETAGLGAPDIPVILYSSASWRPRTDRTPGSTDDSIWEVVEEPIRSADLLAKLDRLVELGSLWRTNEGNAGEAEAEGLWKALDELTILDSIAARSDAEIGCVVLGATRTGGPGDRRRGSPLASVPERIRASDLHAWVGPAELVVFLYGAGLEGIGQFVARVSCADEATDDRPLSAGIVTLRPQARARGDRRSRGPAARIRVLSHVVAARRALDEARAAGGGVRVAASQ